MTGRLSLELANLRKVLMYHLCRTGIQMTEDHGVHGKALATIAAIILTGTVMLTTAAMVHLHMCHIHTSMIVHSQIHPRIQPCIHSTMLLTGIAMAKHGY